MFLLFPFHDRFTNRIQVTCRKLSRMASSLPDSARIGLHTWLRRCASIVITRIALFRPPAGPRIRSSGKLVCQMAFLIPLNLINLILGIQTTIPGMILHFLRETSTATTCERRSPGFEGSTSINGEIPAKLTSIIINNRRGTRHNVLKRHLEHIPITPFTPQHR